MNLLPLRLEIDPASPATGFARLVQGAVLDAFEHQAFTYGSLLAKLALPRDPSRLPLVSVMFNLDRALDPNEAGFPGLDASLESNPRAFENFELFVNAVQQDGALRLECQYSTSLFDATTVRQWLACYEALLRSACANPGQSLGDLSPVPLIDKERFAAWNATALPYDRGILLHEPFERIARTDPGRAALRFADRRLTYRELDSLSNRLATTFRERGVRRGSLVGLHLPRGVEMLAALLGVLKAGAAYVPLDPAYPAERLAFMAADAGIALLVSQSGLGASLGYPAERTLDLDEAQWRHASEEPLPGDGDSATPESPAYVIYTSGSTGKPKGVVVPHRCVLNFIAAMTREPGLDATDRIVAVTTLSFDIAVNELLVPLAAGAEVILASPDQAGDGTLLAALIAESEATVLQATPATWRLLLEAGWKGAPALRGFCGGEALAGDLARALHVRCRSLWNLYGPTETTVWSTCARITDPSAPITIGRPIANTTVHVLDERRRPCPVGVPGEIWIGGDGVADGYLGRPDLTADRFIDDPFVDRPGARIYRTGDRGRWRLDGMLEHLGRLDHQVKVRGYRIELGEIESVLACAPEVGQAVVIVREDRAGDQRLVAYITARPGEIVSEDSLKAHARRALPEYMVPHHVVAIDRVPRLPNGKLDRRALPAPQAQPADRLHAAPQGDIEATVAREMEAVLGMPGVGREEDFFSLGGHSLLAAQLTARINREFGTGLTMRSVFSSPTIAGLARLVGAGQGEATRSSAATVKPLARRDIAPLSVMQERIKFLEDLYPGRVTYHAPSAHRLKGPLDAAAFERAFREMIGRQPALRTRIDIVDGVTVQRIEDSAPLSLFPAEDLSGLPAPERESALSKRLAELTARTFDLASAPLFRAHLFRLAPEEHALFFMPHHIVWDGWSFDLLYEELSALYGAYAEGGESPLPELPVTYGDYCAWHRSWMQGDEFRGQVALWRHRLEERPPVRDLPSDRPRRPGMSGDGNTEWISIDPARTQALHALGRPWGATMFITMLAAYGVLLQAWSGERFLVIGTPVRGRNAPDLEGVMGFFNNLLPLSLPIDPAEPFPALVSRVKQLAVEGFGSPDVPLEELAGELLGAGAPLYQALFSFQDARQRPTRWGRLEHSVIPLFQKGATEDLGLWFVETPGGMHGGITYNTALFADSTVRELRRGFLALLDEIVAHPELDVASLAAGAGIVAHVPEAETLAMPPATISIANTQPSRPPATPTERLLAEIWQEQLKLPAVGLDDNFFDLGGHSLLAMQAIVAMETKTGRRIDRARYIFETLGQIARAYDDAPVEAAAKPGVLRSLFSSLVGGRKD